MNEQEIDDIRRLILEQRALSPDWYAGCSDYLTVRGVLTSAGMYGRLAAKVVQERDAPVDMILYCPMCNVQHVDRAKPEQNWANTPHKTHLCQNESCNYLWRPSNRATNGVEKLS